MAELDVRLKTHMHLDSRNQQTGPTKRFYFCRIFPIPFALIGAIILFVGTQSLQRSYESVNWPSASGIVVSSEIDKRRKNNGTTYSAEILYDYTVDGEAFSSNRVSYGDLGSSNPSRARKIVNRYPKGSTVEVYYMPGKPEESVLETGIQKSTYFLPAFGSVFLIVGIAMFFFMPRILKGQAEQGAAANP